MTLQRGQPLGPYLLVERVGVGSSAQIWRGVAADGFEVALKCFRDAERSDLSQVSGTVRHPNLAAVLESGTTDDGVHWLAREFVDGADLDRVSGALLRRRGPDGVGRGMPVPLACFVFARFADGIDAAHRQLRSAGGGVHGDLCPDHLIVGFDGSAKAINFRGRPPESPILKKVAYSSPEETEGRSTGSRSDVYSLGACLSHLLGGGYVNLGDGAPLWNIDDELQAIVMKALSRAPGARHRWPSELANDLDGYLATSGQSVGPPELSAFMRSLFDQTGEVASRVT